MQSDPFQDWQKLTDVYGKMYDDELRELAADSQDLTEMAQQVLRDEMKKRGLGTPRTVDLAVNRPQPPAPQVVDPGADPSDPDDVPEEGALPHDYTWKTLLCECEERDEAWQISEMLRRAGIESWIEGPGSRYAMGLNNPSVMVAADQLDEARVIAESPIPQDIIDLSKMQVPEFELPVCPKCGDGNPVLEGVEPANSWRCEACGNEWSDPSGEPGEAPVEAEQ